MVFHAKLRYEFDRDEDAGVGSSGSFGSLSNTLLDFSCIIFFS